MSGAPLQYAHKELPFTVDQIKAAVDKYPTPFHIYNEKAIRENAANFGSEFRKYFPQFKNYFAVKATPNPHIMNFEGRGHGSRLQLIG